MKHVLVIGGSGFLGRSVCEILSERKFQVKATVRDEKSLKGFPAGVAGQVTGELEYFTDWIPFLDGIDRVIHLAARVHQMNDTGVQSESL